MAQGKVASLGPIKQQTFLKNMGIDVRLKVLLDKSDEPSMRQQLLHGYDMLMNPEKMGERFNFFALLPHQRHHGGRHQMNACQSKPSAFPVAGFSELAWQ
uniref:Protein arginine methyltransferase NDUFAF7 n=1 Tax=Prolemur simus TaxID=1328070 RepID=A0A8C8Y955_PROSS